MFLMLITIAQFSWHHKILLLMHSDCMIDSKLQKLSSSTKLLDYLSEAFQINALFMARRYIRNVILSILLIY